MIVRRVLIDGVRLVNCFLSLLKIQALRPKIIIFSPRVARVISKDARVAELDAQLG